MILREADAWPVIRAQTEAARRAAAQQIPDDSARKRANAILARKIVQPLTADQYEPTLAANPYLRDALEGNFAGELDPSRILIITPERPDRFASGVAGVQIELARYNHQREQQRADLQNKAARIRNSAAGRESAAASEIMDRK